MGKIIVEDDEEELLVVVRSSEREHTGPHAGSEPTRGGFSFAFDLKVASSGGGRLTATMTWRPEPSCNLDGVVGSAEEVAERELDSAAAAAVSRGKFAAFAAQVRRFSSENQ